MLSTEKTVERTPKRRGKLDPYEFTTEFTTKEGETGYTRDNSTTSSTTTATRTTTTTKRQSGPLPAQQHKLKISMRGDRGDREHREHRERDQPLSPTHSSMRLPSHPGLGSAASSIRSFQTDLSSIAEDQALDYPHTNPKHPSYLFPMKSAMKAGSGPPSIISEAVSEESRSSIGTHDRKGKARVSFSDEQENQVNPGAAAAPAATTTAATAAVAGKGAKDGFLKPQNAAVLGKMLSLPASPPMSPEVSPHVPTVIPPMPAPSMPTPPNTQPESLIGKPTTPLSKETTPNGPALITTTPSPKPVTNDINNTPQVTIHVSPTSSIPPKTRLPGSFPDPTPDPTPPSTAESVSDAYEMSDTLSPLPAGKQSQPVAETVDDLDLRTMTLVPSIPGGLSPESEKMVRRFSSESQGSGMSVYSDAMDDLTPEQKEAKRRVKAEARINGSQGRQAQVSGSREKQAPVNGSKEKESEGERPSMGTAAGVGIAAEATTTSLIAASTTKPTKTVRASSVPKPPGAVLPTKSPMKLSLRENGTTAPRTTLRSSSVPPTSTIRARDASRGRKPMRMSLRTDNERTTGISSSADMARGLMSLPQIERIPSDSSFKRLKRREFFCNANNITFTTCRLTTTNKAKRK